MTKRIVTKKVAMYMTRDTNPELATIVRSFHKGMKGHVIILLSVYTNL